jgi:hypothetical protein
MRVLHGTGASGILAVRKIGKEKEGSVSALRHGEIKPPSKSR